ncbi:MAG TPA: LytTR family DNA-binding domain-containing protein [Burkholderiaceae bacterium]
MTAAHAIIADDERLMREQLRARLAEVWPELQIVGEAKNGQEAVELVQQLRPQLAFLDIRMPGLTGVEAARAIDGACHIVFVTAYGEFAIEAFEQGAVDYVLKPAETARLEVTVNRLKQRLQAPPPDLGALLDQLARKLDTVTSEQRGAPHLQWIQATIGQQLRMIPVSEILFFVSDEKYTRVQTETYEALIRVPIRELVEQLDPELFWQIHRATIVNVRAIAGVVRDLRGRQLVSFKSHPEKLEVSRTFTHLFKQM